MVCRRNFQGVDLNLKSLDAPWYLGYVVRELIRNSLLTKVGTVPSYWEDIVLLKFVTDGVIGWVRLQPDGWDENGCIAVWHISLFGFDGASIQTDYVRSETGSISSNTSTSLSL